MDLVPNLSFLTTSIFSLKLFFVDFSSHFMEIKMAVSHKLIFENVLIDRRHVLFRVLYSIFVLLSESWKNYDETYLWFVLFLSTHIRNGIYDCRLRSIVIINIIDFSVMPHFSCFQFLFYQRSDIYVVSNIKFRCLCLLVSRYIVIKYIHTPHGEILIGSKSRFRVDFFLLDFGTLWEMLIWRPFSQHVYD